MLRNKNTKNYCVIVDLDFTLVNVNTTFDFLRTFFHRKYVLFSKLLRPLALLNKVLGSDVYKQLLLIICAKKKTREELKSWSKAYFEHILTHRDRHLNITLLNFLKNAKCKKILLTSSIDIIAKRFKELGFDSVVCSKICYKDGKFIGIQDLYSKKHKVIEALSEYFDEILLIEDAPEPENASIKGVKIIKVSINEN